MKAKRGKVLIGNDGSPLAGRERSKEVIKSLPWILLSPILILHFLFLRSLFAPAIATPDANGYWAQGSLLFTTGRTWFTPESDVQYIGDHWFVTDSGRYFSQYPPGLSVLVGLVYRLFGFRASVWINPVLATMSLIGLYLLSRRLLGPWWGVAGVFVLAMNPVFNQHALWCFAHMAVTFCLVWGLFFLVRWSEWGKLWEIFLAGLLFGYIPTIRYPEALFAIGVAIFLLGHLRSRKRIGLHYLAAISGAALPLVPLLIRNQLAFGAFYRTAYALTHEQTAFGWEYFKSHFVSYIRGLQGVGVGLFFPLGVMGMTMMGWVLRWRRVGVLWVMLSVPSTLLYMAYYWSPHMAPMRFLLPTFICYILAGVWLLARVTDRTSTLLKSSVVAVVLLLQFIWGGFSNIPELKQLHYQKEVLARVTDALEHTIKHGDVLIAHPQILQHLDFVRHWRLMDPRVLLPVQRLDRPMQRRAPPNAPMPMQAEKQRIQDEKYSGLDPEEKEHKIAQDLLAWTGEHKVYYMGTESELQNMQGAMFNSCSFKVMARIPLPTPPLLPEPERTPGIAARRPMGNRRFPPGGPDIDRFRPAGGGPRQGFPPRPIGGPMGRWGFLEDTKELVIAEWIYSTHTFPTSVE